MKITVLTENTSAQPFVLCEHGLSLYIETDTHKILFDTGQTDAFAANAEQLGVDLTQVDFAVLSHGHYDHGGGLRKFLAINDHAPVYLSRYAFGRHFNRDEKYIGLDAELQDSGRLIFTGDTAVIDDGLALYTCNERETLLPINSDGLTVVLNGKYVPEKFRHEQYLLISDYEKRVLISGCSHKGVENIVNWFHPDVMVGGFHLMNQPLDEALEQLARRLDAAMTDYYTCHCTGEEQYAYMKPLMKRLRYIAAGQTIEI